MQRLTAVIICFISLIGHSQEGSTLFGLQYKPIIPNRIIGTFEQSFNTAQLESSIKQTLGHSYGMVARHGFTKMISMEAGINYNFRKFNLNWAIPDSGYAAENAVRIVSYEIPVMGLVFIQLGEELWMDAAIGSSITFFSSDVRVRESVAFNEYFQQEGRYPSKIQGALLANIGFEYRTKNSGYFYLGSSFHLPYGPIMKFAMSFEHPPGKVVSIQDVRGSYLTLDLRYFLPENKKEK